MSYAIDPSMKIGTKLKGNGLNLILEDTEFLTEDGTFGEDEYLAIPKRQKAVLKHTVELS